MRDDWQDRERAIFGEVAGETRATWAEDSYIPVDGAWNVQGLADIVAGSHGLENLHRCHICGQEGGH